MQQNQLGGKIMNSIIVMFNFGDKELNMPLYDFLDAQYRFETSILVCHVTPVEYKIMQTQIKSSDHHCLQERLPRVTSKMEYDMFRYVVVYDQKYNHLLVSDYDNVQTKGSYIIDENGIHYDKDAYPITKLPYTISRGLKIYTTESYNDIVEHYKHQQDIEILIKQKSEELISLIGKSCKTCNTECTGGLKVACERWSYIIH